MRYLILGVLLQGSGNALLSQELTLADTLRFSAVAFALAAAGAALARRLQAPRSGWAMIPTRDVVSLNVATAVTFLSFYMSLVWVPASVAAGVEVGVAPAVALAMWGRRARTRQWLVVGALLAACITFGVLQGDAQGIGRDAVLGMGLATLAGIGMAIISILSHRLGSQGIRALDVLAVRYHLTYLVAALAALVAPSASGGAQLSWGHIVGYAAVAVVTPLALYQIGMGRTAPVIALGLITLVPITSFLVEAGLGRPVTAATCLAILTVVTLAVIASQFRPHAPNPAPLKTRKTPPP